MSVIYYNTLVSDNIFTIEGLNGRPSLEGQIEVYGAKNALLPAMAAACLVEGETHLENVPGIADVGQMTRILEGLGAYVTRGEKALTISAKEMGGTVLDSAAAKSLRASILLIGPVLARLGRVTFPHPGGDLIGERPIDLFVRAFESLGATFSSDGNSYVLEAPNGLNGGEIFFRGITVTGTETVMMAATLAKGPVTLKNCAMEPEVIATADLLRGMGARITGDGTPTITISPSALFAPSKPFRIIPDRIEAASFLALGALSAKHLDVTNVEPRHLDAVIDMLNEMGVETSISKDAIAVRAREILKPIRVRTHEYPGFATDAQPPFMVLLTQAEGESVLIESIFDGRLNYTSELVQMGANITLLSPHKAKVIGKTPLKAASINTPDIRAGLAFILAASIAEGTSTVMSANLIDRGYESIEKRLQAVGLSIIRS